MWFLFAATSAFCFGLRGILYQWTSQKPLDRNLMLFGVYLCGTAVSLAAVLFTGQDWSYGTVMGVTMGAFSFVSNAAMYKGFAVGKASLVAIFTGLPAVVVVAAAFLLWGESPGLGQFGAFIIIIAGILLIRYTNDLSIKNLQGVHWAVLAMFGFALTDLSSKQSVLWHGEIFPTLAVMYMTGSSLFFLSWWKASRKKGRERERADTEQQWSAGRTLLWGFIVGFTNISGMILILPAFRLGVTGLVTAVIATNVLIILCYVRIVLKNRFSRTEIAGIALTLAGVFLLLILEK